MGSKIQKFHEKSQNTIFSTYIDIKKLSKFEFRPKICFSELEQLLISLTNHWKCPRMHFRWFYRLLKFPQNRWFLGRFSMEILKNPKFVLKFPISRQNLCGSLWICESKLPWICKKNHWISLPKTPNRLESQEMVKNGNRWVNCSM